MVIMLHTSDTPLLHIVANMCCILMHMCCDPKQMLATQNDK